MASARYQRGGMPPNSTCLAQSARFSEFPPFCTPDPYGNSMVFRNSDELGDNPGLRIFEIMFKYLKPRFADFADFLREPRFADFGTRVASKLLFMNLDIRLYA